MSSITLNPTLEYYGSSGIITVDIGTLQEDITQLSSVTSVWKIKKDKWLQLPKILDAHPVFTTLGVHSREVSLRGAFAEAKCVYKGISASYADTTPIYELEIGLTEAPLATHPLFYSDIAGTPTAPKNGSIWEKQDQTRRRWHLGAPGAPPTTNNGWLFVGFLVSDNTNPGLLSEFAGITAFLDVNLTWKKTWNSKATTTQINTAGKIDTPEGPPPTVTGRNWLNMGLTQTRQGSAYQKTIQWRMSGRRKFNEKIYGKP